MRIRSKCDWYEYGEKSSKCFLNLENLEPVWHNLKYYKKDRKV